MITSTWCYRQAKNNNQKSGTHDDFHEFIMGNAWILYYHERMEEAGDDSSLYLNLANPTLLSNVFITSDGVTEAPRADSNNSSKKTKMNAVRMDRDQSIVERNQYYRERVDG
jgi:hypothetical protein